MQFEKNMIYHVFNQGNNREQVFFNSENYLFFLQKMRTHLLPYAELLCYCLMPNHFHWLIQVVEPELVVNKGELSVKRGNVPYNSLEVLNSYDDSESSYELSTSKAPSTLQIRSLNNSIAILLRSYTRAVNVQENRSGSLFRAHTQARSSWIDEFITVDRYRHGRFDFRAFPDDDYGYHCFNYIHNNPCAAGLCTSSTDWDFSSARDFAGLRNGTLCNQDLAKALLKLP
jgi:putative transposase